MDLDLEKQKLLFTCVFSCHSFLNAFVKDTTFFPAEMEIDYDNLF